MQILLTYIYTGNTGQITLQGEELVSLLSQAHAFGLKRCAALIETHIRRLIDQENVRFLCTRARLCPSLPALMHPHPRPRRHLAAISPLRCCKFFAAHTS